MAASDVRITTKATANAGGTSPYFTIEAYRKNGFGDYTFLGKAVFPRNGTKSHTFPNM